MIIGVLGAMVLPQFMSRPDQAKVTATRADIKAVGTALEMYRLDNFQYPSTQQGLEALVKRPLGVPEPRNWNPQGYLKSLPVDPWGTPYFFHQLSSTEMEIRSAGPDKRLWTDDDVVVLVLHAAGAVVDSPVGVDTHVLQRHVRDPEFLFEADCRGGNDGDSWRRMATARVGPPIGESRLRRSSPGLVH